MTFDQRTGAYRTWAQAYLEVDADGDEPVWPDVPVWAEAVRVSPDGPRCYVEFLQSRWTVANATIEVFQEIIVEASALASDGTASVTGTIVEVKPIAVYADGVDEDSILAMEAADVKRLGETLVIAALQVRKLQQMFPIEGSA